ncbi:MAG: hypothetical protein QOF14_4457 [Hyphomicrobiales bacterium]|jgi:ABC-type nitrate/sulfonate/bicarbonate transport system permease component|nr:hypothetical protein [Hyphomicrobiales bacterium]
MTASATATRIGSIALIAALILLWWLAAISGVLPRAFFPNPVDAFREAADGLLGGDLGAQLAATVWRMIQGWLLAGLVGVALGAMIGISATVRAYLQPTLEFLRPLPASAVIPIAISILGLSSPMALSVIIFGSIWPTLLSTVHGFATVDVRLREVARCYRMSRLQFIYKIGIPNALPDIFAGLRLSLTISLILAVVCEMLASQIGLGTAILQAARSFRSAELFAGMLFLGLIGLAGDFSLRQVERRMLAWKNVN